MSIHRRQWLQAAGLTGIAGYICGCRSAPMTGRRQLIVMSESQERALAEESFREIVDNQPASQNVPLVQLVHRVGQRIAEVARRADFDWEFRLIDSPEQNAFCLPGGKVAIYEGMLPVCENEAGLAVVMSHEIGHVLARHGGERISRNVIQSGVEEIAARVTRSRASEQSARLMQAYGVSSEFETVMPFSRKQETEADHIGVMLMAQAGYDPNEAPRFWQRSNTPEGRESSEFSTTHAVDPRRGSELLARMAEAGRYYNDAATKYGYGQAITAQTRL